ncbi:MAG: VWA domain-containing protein, partial [Chloroflexota bacterium]|nr:VWA domain-containing protein [Chloroflexota bacterium]
VDTVALPADSGPEVLVDHVAAPAAIHSGERFSVRVQVISNTETDAAISLARGDEVIGVQSVRLRQGSTDVSFPSQAPDAAGLLTFRASVDPAVDTVQENNAASTVVQVQGPPRVLIAEGRPDEGAALSAALAASGMLIETRAATDLPTRLEDLGAYAAVVLADVAASSLDEAQQATVRAFVRDLGRGLVAIGGDTSFGQGDYIGTPIDDALPVRSSVRAHREQGRVALVLVVDRSGSMADDPHHEGTTKLAMARQAAALSVEELGPRDLVGVLAFDSYQHWLVPMTTVLGVGLPALQERIGSLTADGGTDIYHALQTGFETARRADAQYRHVILMSDGMSCCGGDYTSLLDEMRSASVTLSTIAVGGDADQQLLTTLAREGDGRYYFAEHARDIPRLMTRETNLATRGPLVEGAIEPRQVSPDATLSEVAAAGLPPLGGYLVTTPKPLAEVLLVSDAADPLLARWPYGLGRAVAWTSDLRGRWSAEWLSWPGMQRLFSAAVGWTIPPTEGSLHVALRAGPDSGHITVETTSAHPEATALRARVAGPAGHAASVDLAGTGPGRYEGEFPLAGPGTYLVRVEAEGDGGTVAAADAALPVSYAAEFRRVSADPNRLEQIARAGGGQVLSLDTPADAFADNLAPLSNPMPVHRVLLLLAAVLLPIDIAVRRLRLSPDDLRDWLRHPSWPAVSRPAWLGGASSLASVPAPVWLPGRGRRKRSSARVARPSPRSTLPSTLATPALARQADEDSGADDALAETLRWLEARRNRPGA